jgi:hypothetical protein
MSDDWDDWGDEPAESVKNEEKPAASRKNSSNKGHFTAWEDQVIRDNWQTETDSVIGEKIGRGEDAIARRRKHLNLSKKVGRPRRAARKAAILENPTEHSLSKLSKEDRIQFYKTKFSQNIRYGWLLRILLGEEMEYYKTKYIEIMDNLDSITHQEEDLLHSMIMKDIQIMRLQSQIKEQLEQYYDDDEEERRPPPQYLYQDLDKAEQAYVKYQEKLKLTREQRLKTDREEKITVSSLVREYRDMEKRQRGGQVAGELSYFTKKCKDDMVKMQFLIGE